MAEHRIVAPKVTGSSPVGHPNFLGAGPPVQRDRPTGGRVGPCARGYHRPMTFTTRVPGAVLTEREHVVPLDHARPDGPTISVFTREVADPDGLDRPYLVFLQGGPGIEATRPTAPPTGWMARALLGLPRAAARPARDRPVDAGRQDHPRRHG